MEERGEGVLTGDVRRPPRAAAGIASQFRNHYTHTMRSAAAVFAIFSIALPAHAADWQPVERVKLYAISGATGAELYAAIGERGPLIGAVRAIAHTNWDLKWSRQYMPDGSACTLVSAKPFLTITTTLPKPAAALAGPAGRLWKVFSDGIAAHEKVHAAGIGAMVDEIITSTVGLRQENDPGCQAIRTEVLKRVTAANEAYKAKSRAFDQAEMSNGGNVQRLILGLVNGR
jgi:predicted secreted Zn-dependent protease